MQDDAASGQAAYAPLHGETPAIAKQPSVIALPAPRPYGSMRISRDRHRCLPARNHRGVYSNGWCARAAGKFAIPKIRPNCCRIASQHICLLFRRFTNFGKDITRDYVRSLEAREIPHLLVGSKSFHSREEVETLRAALTAIEWPEDELSVFATLKGSLFAIPDDLLLALPSRDGTAAPVSRATDRYRGGLPADC